MRFLRLIRALGLCWLALGLSAIFFLFWAISEGEGDAARGFALTFVVGVFLGGMTWILTQGLGSPARASSALRLAFFGWITLPCLAAAPFIDDPRNIDEALFESFSAMTTTGASVYNVEDMPHALLAWRAWLQWLGGLATLVLSVTIFAALDQRGPGMRRTTMLTVEDQDLFTNLGRATRRIGSYYAGATIAGIALLTLTGLSLFDAFCMALSGISTGGMAPHDGPIDTWMPGPSMVVLMVLMGVGAWNMGLQYEFLARGRLSHHTPDLRMMAMIAVGAGVVLAAFEGWGHIPGGVFDAFSALTTTGYLTHVSGTGFAPVFLILLAFIGGSAVSTTGGVKISRIALLLKRTQQELALLTHPNAAVRTHLAGRLVSDEALVSVWVYALVFPGVAAIGTLLLGFSGADFGDAWRAASASVLNAGPVSEIDYSQLSMSSLGLLSILMIIGRMEVLAAAAAIFVIFSRD